MFWVARYNPARVSPELTVSYWIKVGTVLASVAAIVAARRQAFHPFPAFGPANWITTLRAALVAAVAGFVSEAPDAGSAAAAIVIGAMAATLDGVDGAVARRTRMTSAFGARYDMEIDALLIMVLSLLAWQYGKAGAWILASGLLRYVFVAAGWLLPWMRAPLSSTGRARLICALQIITLLACLVPALDPPSSAIVAAIGLLALTYSFALDTMRLWRQR